MRAIIAFGFISLVVACSPPAPPEDPVLPADPPVGGAQALSSSTVSTELERAIAYIKNEKFEDAKKHLEIALKEKPDDAEANHYMGVATEMLGDKTAAEGFYKKALAADPSLSESATNLAAIYLDEPPRPDEAIAVLKKALEKAPGSPDLNQNLGYAYGLKGDYANAAKAYEVATKKKDDVLLHLSYGQALLQTGDKAKAAEQLKKALGATTDDLQMLATLGRGLAQAGAYADCVKAFDQAIKLKNHPELLVLRGNCKHELNDEPAARADFEAATKADPKYVAGHYYLGVSYSLEKKYKLNALKALETAAKLGEGTKLGKMAKEKLDELKKRKP